MYSAVVFVVIAALDNVAITLVPPLYRPIADEFGVERAALMHRSPKATRPVPVAPQLTELLDRHIEQFPPTGGRLFVTRRGPGGRYIPSLGRPERV